MTTYIYADNYRGFRNTLIPIERVNFLVGENSSGKSSFLLLLETMAQLNFWGFEPRFGAPEHNEHHFLDLVSVSSSDKKNFTVGAILIPSHSNQKIHGMFVTYSSLDGRPVPSKVSIAEGGTIRSVAGSFYTRKKGDTFKCASKKFNAATLSKSPEHIANSFAKFHISSKSGNDIINDHFGEPTLIRFKDRLYENPKFDPGNFEIKAPDFVEGFVEIAPIRSRPKRTYDSPQTSYSSEGAHTPYVIRRRLKSSATAKSFKSFMDYAGKGSGLFSSIEIKEYSDEPRAPFEVNISLDKSPLSLDTVGYGVSQSLPVIVEAFIRPKKSTFSIQQPEVHLHPRAQAMLGDLIAQLARSDAKKFFIETHSDFLIDRFRINIKKHQKESSNFSSQILYFQHSSGTNTVYPIKIERDGSIGKSQPSEYREFFIRESLSLL
ncbi:AAA family ATPase [Rhodanobacter geophilus]|uniref:AAA family ATPase n=1 Tax=Rhodanobacter geophilus TaxID=3162488 RepID=A0ABV3QLM0_9GAMM